MSLLDFALEIAEGHRVGGQLGREALEGDLFIEMLVVREPHDAARAPLPQPRPAMRSAS